MWRFFWIYTIDVLLALAYAVLWVIARVRRSLRHVRAQ
jgi:hypothetical protein